MKSGERIEILDGFRFLAILPVLFFHFYARWTPPLDSSNYYAYGDKYASFFKHGNLGVAFFFIISGFVIFYTLKKCKGYKDFLMKRFVRLFPAMLMCSLITYFLVPVIDPGKLYPKFHSSTALDFLPSLTFTSPYLWNKLLGTTDIKHVSGAYWSLWVEVYFYIVAGGLFFYRKEKFVSSWLKLVTVVLIITGTAFFLTSHSIVTIQSNKSLFVFLGYVNIFREEMHLTGSGYNLYFSLGIVFYCHYKQISLKKTDYAMLGVMWLYHFLTAGITANILLVLMMVLFLAFIYKPRWLLFLESGMFSQIGVISYSLYLIHEGIGVILIGRTISYTGLATAWLIPLLIMVVLILFSFAEYHFYEKQCIRFLRRMLARKPRLPEK